MIYPHDIDLATRFSTQALQRLKDDAVPATPNNFAVWYVYYAKENQDVIRAVDTLIKEHGKLDEKGCQEIYNRFLNDNRTEARVRQAGDNLQSTINNVKNVVSGVKSSTSDYHTALEDIHGKLTPDSSAEDIKKIVDDVKSSTQQVITRNQSLEVVLEESATEIEKLKHDLEKARKESLTDSLTGLANRKAFDFGLQQALDDYESDKTSFTLLMLDIDHFKSFNDNFGHQVGDQVLRLVSKCLTDGVKGKDTASRYGGEEFAIILPDTELAAGVAVANNLRKIVAGKDVVNRGTGERFARITMSAGVAQFSGTESIEELIGRADAALYTAKHNGRNQVAAAPTPL